MARSAKQENSAFDYILARQEMSRQRARIALAWPQFRQWSPRSLGSAQCCCLSNRFCRSALSERAGCQGGIAMLRFGQAVLVVAPLTFGASAGRRARRVCPLHLRNAGGPSNHPHCPVQPGAARTLLYRKLPIPDAAVWRRGAGHLRTPCRGRRPGHRDVHEGFRRPAVDQTDVWLGGLLQLLARVTSPPRNHRRTPAAGLARSGRTRCTGHS